MPLYAGELNVRRGAPLAEYPAPLSEVLRAQAEDTRINNPTNALLRLNEITSANSDRMVDPGAPELGIAPAYEPVQRMDAETARARVKDEGLPLTIPDDGISTRALDILINAKRQELQRQNVFARGPTGFGPGAARLGTALINSLYDPLNIASAFIPVVGEARYAAMLGRAAGSFGRAGVRMGVGAAEGAVGAAILEPLVYAANKAEQLDYTMADSLANIAFGGLFGGGLHAAGGAVRDVVQPGWWRTAAATGEAPRVDGGTQPDVPMLKGMGDVPEVPRTPMRSPDAMDALDVAKRMAEAEQRPGFQRTAEDLIALKGERTPEIERAIEILKQEGFQRTPEDRVFLAALEKGHEADFINDRVSNLLKQIDEIDNGVTARGNSTMDAAVIERKRPLTEQLDRAVNRLAELGRPVNEAAMVMERVSPETRQNALRAAVVQAVEGRVTDVDALIHADPAARVVGGQPQGRALNEARAVAERNAKPESIRSADPEGSAAAERTVRESSKQGRADLDAAEAELSQSLDVAEQLADLTGMRDDLNAALKPYAADIQRAEQYAAALKAGAACGIA